MSTRALHYGTPTLCKNIKHTTARGAQAGCRVRVAEVWAAEAGKGGREGPGGSASERDEEGDERSEGGEPDQSAGGSERWVDWGKELRVAQEENASC